MAVPDWVKIWFLARSAASAAKSASLMVDMLALLFWVLFIRLVVNEIPKLYDIDSVRSCVIIDVSVVETTFKKKQE